MKKIALLCAACVLVLTACQSTGNSPDITAKPDSHNARIALDVEGRYEVGKPVTGTDIREVWIKSGNRYAVTLANGINVSGHDIHGIFPAAGSFWISGATGALFSWARIS